MHIWIDGDGCPVVDETVRQARRFGVPCTILCDTSHVFQKPGTDTIVCDKGADSVDYKLVSLVRPGDLVVMETAEEPEETYVRGIDESGKSRFEAALFFGKVLP